MKWNEYSCFISLWWMEKHFTLYNRWVCAGGGRGGSGCVPGGAAGGLCRWVCAGWCSRWGVQVVEEEEAVGVQVGVCTVVQQVVCAGGGRGEISLFLFFFFFFS